jgi:hypothetical protein
MCVFCSAYDLFMFDSERYSLWVTNQFSLLAEVTVNAMTDF